MGKRKGKKIKQRQKRKQKQKKKERREKKMKINIHWGDYDYYGGSHWGGFSKTSSGGWVSKHNCHTGNPLVFTTDDGIEVYAGGTSRNGAWYRMDPLPDLAIGPMQVIGGKKDGTTVPDGFSCRDHILTSTVPMVLLDLPDYKIPQDVEREFWVALVDDIRRLGYKRISTQCVGGHGRTGIQLAILAHLFGVTDQPDSAELIRWVRDRYCVHAVEAASQQKYIAEVCELPLGDDLFPPAIPKSSVKTVSSVSLAKEKEKEDEQSLPLEGDHAGFEFFTCGECMHHEWVHFQDTHLKHSCPECQSHKEWERTPDARFNMQKCTDCNEDVSWYSVIPYKNDDLCRCCYADMVQVDIEVDNAIHDDSVPGAWKISCTECDELHPMDFFGDGADELVCIKCIDTRNLAQTFQEKKAKETEMVYKSAVKNETTKEENE